MKPTNHSSFRKVSQMTVPGMSQNTRIQSDGSTLPYRERARYPFGRPEPDAVQEMHATPVSTIDNRQNRSSASADQRVRLHVDFEPDVKRAPDAARPAVTDQVHVLQP